MCLCVVWCICMSLSCCRHKYILCVCACVLLVHSINSFMFVTYISLSSGHISTICLQCLCVFHFLVVPQQPLCSDHRKLKGSSQVSSKPYCHHQHHTQPQMHKHTEYVEQDTPTRCQELATMQGPLVGWLLYVQCVRRGKWMAQWKQQSVK